MLLPPRITNLLLKVRDFLRRRPPLAIASGSVLMLCFLPVLLFLLTQAGLFGSIPGKKALQQHHNLEAARIFSVDEVMIGTFHIENRVSVTLDSVSPFFISCLLATEDVRFYDHNGVDLRSWGRVFFLGLLGGNEEVGGGSTLTQQLAKAWFPRRSYFFLSLPINKFREIATAMALERTFSKTEILELYLNSVSFGEDIFGIEAAARRYFAKPASRLLAHESALLVGMLKGPSLYHPVRNPEAARERRNLCLRQMVKYQHLTTFQSDSLQYLGLGASYRRPTHHEGMAPHFREMLRQDLAQWAKEYEARTGETIDIYRSGLRIHTTLHSHMQAAAEQALKDQMRILQKRFDAHWKGANKRKASKGLVDDMIRRTAAARNLGTLPPDSLAAQLARQPALPGFSWNESTAPFSALDSIIQEAFLLNAGLLAVDPTTGHIKAWVGGIDHRHRAFDQITAQRQPGSVFKPVVYAAALEQGVDPCSYISNEWESYEEGQQWIPRNADGQYGGMYSMEGAIANSVNVVAARLIQQIGVRAVLDLAPKLGIRSELPAVASLALGAGEVDLLDIVSAFGVFANQGKLVMPRYLLRIEDRDGKVLADYSAQDFGTVAVQPRTAAMMNDMLQAVVREGTARSLITRHRLKMPLAGKTGTTQNQSDGWFVAYNPALVVGARVGGEDLRIHWRSLSQGQGASTALPIVGSFLQSVMGNPTFDHVHKSRFPSLEETWREELDCEGFSFPLAMSEFKVWFRAREIADSLQLLGLPVPDSIRFYLQSDSGQ